MMDEAARLNQAAYDQIAGRFAERNGDMSEQLVKSGEHLLAHLSAENLGPPLILDLGCGAGRDMAWFEAHSAQIAGADLSAGMLSEARKRVRGPLIQLDMRFLGLASASFNAVWCQAALLHLPKEQAPAVLNEIARILAPRGLFYVSVQKGSSEGIETRPYEPAERYYAHYQPDELAERLQQAGFIIHMRGERQDRRSWIWFEAQKA